MDGVDAVLSGASGGFTSDFSTEGCEDAGGDGSGGVCGLLRVVEEARFEGIK